MKSPKGKNMLVPVYDILNCGPKKRFVANGKLVHNSDKINLQNLPSRGDNANKLKKAILAPEGYVVIDSDSSQIEARIVAWLAGQSDLVQAFENKEDVYKIMASSIYNKPVADITASERFVGKTTILGAGYGMGAGKFQAQLKTFGVGIELDECQRIISKYRQTYGKIPELWEQAQKCLVSINTNRYADLGIKGVLEFSAEHKGFKLPNGLWQRYESLYKTINEKGYDQYQYKTRKGIVYLYGGKLVENICQALARCVIAEQMVKIGNKYKVVLTVHDAVACVVPESEAVQAREYIEECMRWRPKWAQTLPLNCESGVGKSYGEC